MTAYDRLTIGSRVTTPGRTISDAAASTIVAMAGYTHPMFTDPTYAARSTTFAGRPIPGELSLLYLGGLAEQTDLFDETTLAVVAVDAVEFKTPALVVDTIRLEIEVSEKRRAFSGRPGFITFAWTCRNQRDEIMLAATLPFRTAEG